MLSKTEANKLSEAHRNDKSLDVAIQNNGNQEALAEEDFDALLFEAIKEQNDVRIMNLIDHVMQNNKSIDLKHLNAAISQANPEMIQDIIPHCGFFKPSDRYIPRELVIKSGPNHDECIELLLKWNFTVNPDSKEDAEFVYAAVEKNYSSIVSQLLNIGVNVNMVNSKTGLNLLTIACLLKHHEMVENLLKHKADVNVITPGENSRLNDQSIFHSELREFTKTVSLVPSEDDLRNVTCLHIAVFNSDPIMTELLLKYGAKIISDPKFFKIAYFAIKNGDEDIFRIFLNYGVNVTDIGPRRKTFLHCCVLFYSKRSDSCHSSIIEKDSRYNTAKWLLENGANKLLQTPRNSLVFEAIENGHDKTAQLFLDYNPDVQYVSEDGDTVLHKAIEYNFNLTFITKLFNLNCPVHIVNSDGFTPFFLACRKSPFPSKIIKKLLQYNVDVNCADNNLMTPLHFACSFYDDESRELVRLLLKKGANLNAKNDKSQTPLHCACDHYGSNITTTIIQLFQPHNANIEATDRRGWTPLFIVCEKNNCEAVRLFLINGANANHRDLEKSTPLHIAAKNGFYDVTSWLIEYGGANIDALDNNNRTPFQIVQECLLDYPNPSKFRKSPSYLTYKRIEEILVRHAVKLKVAGLKVNQTFTYTNDRSIPMVVFEKNSTFIEQQYRASYEEEIKKMKMENIGTTGITCYDLLTKNIHFSRFVENKSILEALKNTEYGCKFPSYINIVCNRFREVMIRYKAMNSIREYFRENVCAKLPDECIDLIFSYLSFDDLFTFLETNFSLNY